MCGKREARQRAALAALGALVACAAGARELELPTSCVADPLIAARPPLVRMPPAVEQHLDGRGMQPVSLKELCVAWAGEAYDPTRRRRPGVEMPASPFRFIFLAHDETSLVAAGRRLERDFAARAHRAEYAKFFGVASFETTPRASTIREIAHSPYIAYIEPDCDGPGFAMTSVARTPSPRTPVEPCWSRAARRTLPSDPCFPDLWGHELIDWNWQVADSAQARIVAVLDSGINCAHEDLAANIWRSRGLRGSRTAVSSSPSGCARGIGRDFTQIERRAPDDCDSASGCNPHGTEMAGTIAGAMNNGVGLAGVAPRSKVLPVRISKVEHGSLASLSAIARAILYAGESGADVLNVSAKWPVHSYTVFRAIREATETPRGVARLLVTGYVGSLRDDNTFREEFPSRYRCLPGVIAAVPVDGQVGRLEPVREPAAARDGRLGAPGVDIVVTTTHNRTAAYDVAMAGGASSAAAYVSGSVALAWGTAPLQRCDAEAIRTVMFCRSKRSTATRYPLVNVEFLGELSRLDPRSSCPIAVEALGCAAAH